MLNQKQEDIVKKIWRKHHKDYDAHWCGECIEQALSQQATAILKDAHRSLCCCGKRHETYKKLLEKWAV